MSNQITNFYEQLPKHMIKKTKNPKYGKEHYFKLPCRMMIFRHVSTIIKFN